MTVLVIAEHDNKQLKPSTLATVTAAQAIAAEVELLICGNNCGEVIESATAIAGLKQVLVAEHEKLENIVAENITQVLQPLATNYSHILAPATTFGKNFMPRLAALLDVMVISDVTEIMAADTFKRPIYAGNAIATVKSSDTIKLLTVRTTVFDKCKLAQPTAPIKNIECNLSAAGSEFVELQQSKSERPELTAARVVISGGRGLQNGDNFKMLEQLADKLNAAIGASRAAVDAGFVPNDYQVGQTGKVVAPELYIAIGISGAIQHLAGMKDSKVIVAINKDADAPIFQVADYGLVGDLFEIVPQMIAQL